MILLACGPEANETWTAGQYVVYSLLMVGVLVLVSLLIFGAGLAIKGIQRRIRS